MLMLLTKDGDILLGGGGCTNLALQRSVAYAQIVTALLCGPGFSLNNFQKYRSAQPV